MRTGKELRLWCQRTSAVAPGINVYHWEGFELLGPLKRRNKDSIRWTPTNDYLRVLQPPNGSITVLRSALLVPCSFKLRNTSL